MDFASQIVPAIVVLLANLMSGPRTSLRWEVVTAIFGWGAAASLVVVLVVSVAWPESAAKDYAVQSLAFCLLTALSRDYERIFAPLFKWNR